MAGKINKVEKLSDTVSGEREEWVKVRPLHTSPQLSEMSDEYPNVPSYLFDDALIEDLQSGKEEFFDDPRIKQWRKYRNSLTKKDLSDMIE